MAEISFGKSLQGFEKFYTVYHGAVALLCLIMGVFALLEEEHYVFLPPIFVIGTVTCGVNAYAGFVRVRHKKNRTARFLACVYGLLVPVLGGLSYISIRCFWL